MTSRHKLIAGTAAVAVLAGGGAALAALELTASSPVATSAVTAPAPMGIGGYALGPGRFGGRGLPGGLGPVDVDAGSGVDRVFGGRGFFRTGLAAVASYLGLPAQTIRVRLGSGTTLAQLAAAQGKTVGGLVRALAAAEQQALARAVAAGLLTQAQADGLAARLKSRIDAVANGGVLHARRHSGSGGGSLASTT